MLTKTMIRPLLMTILFLSSGGMTDSHAQAPTAPIRLLVRGDDIGSCHAANIACIQTCKEGIVRSLEIMAPAPWFNEAVELLKKTPDVDVGVHLTLTSEWEYFKWGPLTNAPSLVDPQGHFFPTTSQRSDFPPNTGFLQSKWNIREVEKELRAQIELAKEKIPQVSHLSAHMGTPVCTPELRALAEKLAAEYGLPLGAPGLKHVQSFGGKKTFEEKEQALIQILENLTPGNWLLVDHPGLDCPEMRSIGHQGYWDVAQDRDGVTQAFTSPKVKEMIQKRGIELIGYDDLIVSK
ncbi:MAG: polysaccharide deacetylase family protein [Candidatus Omnitrophica bacterium]|nr:polysaccharide deacetylase family protein [Candidatus Omnitrophota bacterium]